MLLRPLIPRKETKYAQLKPVEAKLPPLPSTSGGNNNNPQYSTMASITSMPASKQGTPECSIVREKKKKKLMAKKPPR
jgi:hypothetical protein